MMTTQLISPKQILSANNQLAQGVIEAALQYGVEEFCLAPASRNASFVYALANSSSIKTYYWGEERSAAFFALGRAKATKRPVAIIVTSGSAAAEMLPAAMVAYYAGIPLLLITADRPRSYRGSGAPQTAEQVGLYSHYVQYAQDLAVQEVCSLEGWQGTAPAHLNVCLEEPSDAEAQSALVANTSSGVFSPTLPSLGNDSKEVYQEFIRSVHYPLVVVGEIAPHQRESAVKFLLHLGAPVYAEGFSGLREDPRLEKLRMTNLHKIWNRSTEQGYPIEGILRLGSVPTARLWRDLEERAGQIQVFSISELPFAGLSWNKIQHASLDEFFRWALEIKPLHYHFSKWQKADQSLQRSLVELYSEEPLAEISLIHTLSKKIPHGAHLFLGNSLPVREWDSGAVWEPRNLEVAAVRGVNGIDGQISTFLGMSRPSAENWAIIGDLTALYDLAGPWIFNQLQNMNANLVIVNNGGGQIFAPMYRHPAFLNQHNLSFESLATLWNWRYERWTSIPDQIAPSDGGRIIELIPNSPASTRFQQKVKAL